MPEPTTRSRAVPPVEPPPGWLGSVAAGCAERSVSHKGSTKLIDEFVDRRNQLEELVRGLAGFADYSLVRAADGGANVSVFHNEARHHGVEQARSRIHPGEP